MLLNPNNYYVCDTLETAKQFIAKYEKDYEFYSTDDINDERQVFFRLCGSGKISHCRTELIYKNMGLTPVYWSKCFYNKGEEMKLLELWKDNITLKMKNAISQMRIECLKTDKNIASYMKLKNDLLSVCKHLKCLLALKNLNLNSMLHKKQQ